MNFRVNLLQQEDVQSGSTGRRNLWATVGVLAGLAVVYLFGSNIYRGLASRSELKEARNRWAKVEDRVEALKTARAENQALQAMAGELEGWRNARVAITPVLNVLYETVPESVQLTRMEMRSSYAAEKVTKRPKPDEKPPPPKLYRSYRIALEGVATGEAGDQVVVDFVARLKALALDSEIFPSVKLLRLQSDAREREENSEVRTFSVEILSSHRMLQP